MGVTAVLDPRIGNGIEAIIKTITKNNANNLNFFITTSIKHLSDDESPEFVYNNKISVRYKRFFI